MIETVFPATIKGKVQAPASKSMAQRAIAAALLANGESRLTGFTPCDDSVAALHIIQTLGAETQSFDYELQIKGGINDKPVTLHCGESGLSSRLFSAIAASLSSTIELQGEGSLPSRPFNMVEQALQQAGVNCQSNKGFLPLKIKGPLKGGKLKVDGSISSQFITGLLMALPLAENDSVLEVSNMTSKPYVDMTLQLLADFGIQVERKGYELFFIKGKQQYTPCQYNIEGDWSGASCLLVAGAIAGEVEVTNLNRHSLQADKAIIEALHKSGAEVKQQESSVYVKKQALQAFAFDATECPDLFPALVALAAYCKGTSTIEGVKRLIHKESNRALTLQQEFGKLGINIELNGNTMLIHGGQVKDGAVQSHNDHRIAMALACAALTATGKVEIAEAESINKSYPAFFTDLRKLIC